MSRYKTDLVGFTFNIPDTTEKYVKNASEKIPEHEKKSFCKTWITFHGLKLHKYLLGEMCLCIILVYNLEI